MRDNPLDPLDGASESSEQPDAGESLRVERDQEPADAERVVRLLAAHGGYAWQAHIVDGLEWAPSKTARILAAMEGAGRVKRYRVGRKHVVCLPHRVPAHLDSHGRDPSAR